MTRRLNLLGNEFGKLTVIKDLGKGHKEYEWLCRCECGNETVSTTSYLRSGHKTSCGCLRWKGTPTHGMAGTRIYMAWQNMKRRCNDPINNSYANYGGRGISYDSKWETFEGFLEDMEEGYSDTLTLDRIDVDGNYSKDNCRWVDRVIQANNMTTNHIIEYKGEELTLAELARKYDKDSDLIKRRIAHHNWDVERALKEEPWEMITYNGVTKRVAEFAEDFGMTYYQLKKRLMRGWTVERALTQPLRKRSK